MPNYTYFGQPVSEQQVINAAAGFGISVEEYLKRNEGFEIVEDSPLVSELLTFPMAEVPYAVPLYKKFRKMKMSRSKSLILSAAIGGGIAYSPKATFFLDSKMARGLREFMNITDNTPEAELYDTAWQMGEYGLTGLLLHRVVDAAKAYKKIISWIKIKFIII